MGQFESLFAYFGRFLAMISFKFPTFYIKSRQTACGLNLRDLGLSNQSLPIPLNDPTAEALLVAITNDSGQPQYRLPIRLTVTQPTAITLSSLAAHQAPRSGLMMLLVGMMGGVMVMIVKGGSRRRARI